jgi:hypothetical protein
MFSHEKKTTGNNLCKMFKNYTKAKDDFTYFHRMRHFYLWNPDKDAICEYAGSSDPGSGTLVGTLPSSCILYAVLGDPDPNSLVRGISPDPDPSLFSQRC